MYNVAIYLVAPFIYSCCITQRSSAANSRMKRRKRKKHTAAKKRAAEEWGAAVPAAPYYEFRSLLRADPSLRKYLCVGELGELTVHLESREATLAITRATLHHFFSLSFALPSDHLVPIVPGRVQYFRWAASLLPPDKDRTPLTCIDVGTGPSAIYALVGARIFPHWRFIATDTDQVAVAVARGNVNANLLENSIRVVQTLPSDPLLDDHLFTHPHQQYAPPAITICNPPFFVHTNHPPHDHPHHQDDDARAPAGTPTQMETPGGEAQFVRRLARDSVNVSYIGIFTSLIGLHSDVASLVDYIRGDAVRATHVISVTLDSGGRTKRWAIAWHFGPTLSIVDIAAPRVACQWRVPLSVIPGRRYANRLQPLALFDIVCTAATGLGWLRLPSSDAKSILISCILSKTIDDTVSQLCLKCGSTSIDSSFSLMLTVERRGALAVYDVYGIAEDMVREIEKIMNGGIVMLREN